MRVTYKGEDPHFKYRIAEINYDEEKEFKKLEELAHIMKTSFGWKIDFVTDGYALCSVDDYEAYRDFMNDWHRAKREYQYIMR